MRAASPSPPTSSGPSSYVRSVVTVPLPLPPRLPVATPAAARAARAAAALASTSSKDVAGSIETICSSPKKPRKLDAAAEKVASLAWRSLSPIIAL